MSPNKPSLELVSVLADRRADGFATRTLPGRKHKKPLFRSHQLNHWHILFLPPNKWRQKYLSIPGYLDIEAVPGPGRADRDPLFVIGYCSHSRSLPHLRPHFKPSDPDTST